MTGQLYDHQIDTVSDISGTLVGTQGTTIEGASTMSNVADTLVTIPQIADMYGVTRQAIISVKHRHPEEFPAPVIKIGSGGAYDRGEIVNFLRHIKWIDSEGKRGAGAGRSISEEKVAQILRAYEVGKSIRQAAEAAGVSEPTARKHLIRAKYIKCNCSCHETD